MCGIDPSIPDVTPRSRQLCQPLSFSGSQITLGVAFSQLSSEDLMANYPQINISLLRRGSRHRSGTLSLLIVDEKKEGKHVWSEPPESVPLLPCTDTSSSPGEAEGSFKIKPVARRKSQVTFQPKVHAVGEQGACRAHFLRPLVVFFEF